MRSTTNIFSKLTSFIEYKAVSKILLYGPPRVGKTTFGYKIAKKLNRHPYTITINSEMSPSDLLGFWQIKNNQFQFYDGIAIQALENNGVLIINEISDTPPQVEPVLMAILDDPDVRSIRLPDGRIVTGHKDFIVIASMNEPPSVLRTALRERFDLEVFIGEPPDAALDKLDEDIREYCKNLYSKIEFQVESQEISYRSLVTFCKLRKIVGDDEAAEWIWNEKGKEIVDCIKLGKDSTEDELLAEEEGEE